MRDPRQMLGSTTALTWALGGELQSPCVSPPLSQYPSFLLLEPLQTHSRRKAPPRWGKRWEDIDFQACLGKKSHLFMQTSFQRSSIEVLRILRSCWCRGTPNQDSKTASPYPGKQVHPHPRWHRLGCSVEENYFFHSERTREGKAGKAAAKSIKSSSCFFLILQENSGS